jgi:DNA-binding NtrC family response regulator
VSRKAPVKQALLSSGSSRFRRIERLTPEQQAEAHKTNMRDVAGDLGITDEKTLQKLEDHAVRENRRKLN